jgi:hypothetical protein
MHQFESKAKSQGCNDTDGETKKWKKQNPQEATEKGETANCKKSNRRKQEM